MIKIKDKLESMFCVEDEKTSKLKSLGGSIIVELKFYQCNLKDEDINKVKDMFKSSVDLLDHSTLANTKINDNAMEFLRVSSARFFTTDQTYPPKAYAEFIYTKLEEALQKSKLDVKFEIESTNGKDESYTYFKEGEELWK